MTVGCVTVGCVTVGCVTVGCVTVYKNVFEALRGGAKNVFSAL